MQKNNRVLLRILSSRNFFVFIVVLLVVQATWIALSFRYPMLWDEYYHFGLIQYYGHHLNPFISHQPTSLDTYGNVERSPKYLYHFLMSFPYRLIAQFTGNQAAQIISLRLVNIGFFAAGLVAFRQAMLQLTKSRALVHFVLFVFVLLPLSSLLAAHINYDNLEFLLAGLMFYWTFRLVKAERFEIKWFALIIGVGLLATVVKYTFFPILAAIVAVLGIHLWRQYGRLIFSEAASSFKRLKVSGAVGLVLLVLLALGLSAERFGVNIVKYHALDPKCSAIISVERCMQFSPFKQEYTYASDKVTQHYSPPHGVLGYTIFEWFYQLYDQYFTTGTQLAYEEFEVVPALKIPYFTFLAAGLVGVVCLVISVRRFMTTEYIIVMASTVLLAASLWVVDYAKYVKTGYPLAIQGRYLTPVVPLLLLVGVVAIDHVVKSRKLKMFMGGLTVIAMLWGGGVITHVVLSDSSWYWQNNVIITTNQAIRNTLQPVTF